MFSNGLEAFLAYFKLEGGGQKGARTKVAEIVRTTILVEKNAGMHDSGSRNWWYARFWLESIAAASCVPLFLSSRIRAYHYFSRAGFVHTSIFSSILIEHIEIDDFPMISGA